MAKVYKNAHALAALVAAEMPEMDAIPAKIADAVREEAAKHRDTGDLERSIHVERGKIDRRIVTDDPAQWSIEYGHLTEDGEDVPAKFVFTNVVRRHGG